MQSPATFSMGLVTKNGPPYLLKIENLTKLTNWAQQLGQGSLRGYYELYGFFYKILPTNSDQQNEENFLKFIQDSNGGSGLKLFRGNNTVTSWQPIKYDKNLLQVINDPCN